MLQTRWKIGLGSGELERSRRDVHVAVGVVEKDRRWGGEGRLTNDHGEYIQRAALSVWRWQKLVGGEAEEAGEDVICLRPNVKDGSGVQLE